MGHGGRQRAKSEGRRAEALGIASGDSPKECFTTESPATLRVAEGFFSYCRAKTSFRLPSGN